MKALQVTTLSDDLSGVELIDAPSPERASGHALIRVHAASLNFPDFLMTQGKYQFKPEPPFISGMELAGEVIEAEPGGKFSVGDRVMGGAKTGGFAEIASIPEKSLTLIPDALGFPHAASLGAAYTTAYTGLVELGRLQAGQTVFVTGASGGVGLAACDLAKALGAKVIAGSGVSEKLAQIEAAVSPDLAIVTEGKFREHVSDFTDGKLADIVFDVVGGDVFDECTRCVAFGGQLQVVGFTSGRIADIATNIPLIKGFSIVGLRAGEYARRFPERGAAIANAVNNLASKGKIAPVIDRTLLLSDWREGIDAMANRDLVGKVVFQMAT